MRSSCFMGTIGTAMLLIPCGFAQQAGAKEARGLRAFRDVASVLTSPRCLNCHVPGKAPLQDDESRPHNMEVMRANDGRGTVAMRCTNCHQESNTSALHSPPGVSGWRMPDAETPMAWQGLTTGELCRALKDLKTNGGKTMGALIEHVSSDKIVNWGWNPGPGRSLPPLSHQEFVAKFKEWVANGAPCAPKALLGNNITI